MHATNITQVDGKLLFFILFVLHKYLTFFILAVHWDFSKLNSRKNLKSKTGLSRIPPKFFRASESRAEILADVSKYTGQTTI